MSEPLLHVAGLATELETEHGPVRLLNSVELTIAPGQTVGLVGESGCGKSLTALSILGLLPRAARVVEGQVLFRGQDLLKASAEQLRALRGAGIAAVFQDAASALDPVFPVGAQLAEVLRAHQPLTRSEARARAVALLERLGIGDAERRADQYPHQLSGGMRQRVLIGMAISCGPALLIADEPTTALDATVQAQIVELLRELQRERGMALLLISHDLALVGQVADEISVMYAGRVVERAPASELFRAPRHPYTEALLRSIPAGTRRDGPLATIAGAVPTPGKWPSGCRFRDRCPRATEACAAVPTLGSGAHALACHHPLAPSDATEARA